MSNNPLYKVACLGPDGTFCKMAAKKAFPDNNTITLVLCDQIKDIYEMVAKGDCDYGVMPIESQNEGSVKETIKTLKDGEDGVNIVGECSVKVSFCLISDADKNTDIKYIYAHEKAYAQCKHWIKQNYPSAKIESANSNADAAQRCKGNKTAAAISNTLSSEAYVVPILNDNIQDLKDNTTRFIVIGKCETPPTSNDKTSVIIYLENVPGALCKVTNAFGLANINMSKIESFPMQNGRWSYWFWIDIDTHIQNLKVKEILGAMELFCKIKILGSYQKE